MSKRWVIVTVVAVFFLLLPGPVLVAATPLGWLLVPPAVILALWGLITSVSVNARLRKQIACPACGMSLLDQLNGPLGRGPQADLLYSVPKCPYCWASLDEETTAAQNQPVDHTR